jgi:hypothetical protein
VCDTPTCADEPNREHRECDRAFSVEWNALSDGDHDTHAAEHDQRAEDERLLGRLVGFFDGGRDRRRTVGMHDATSQLRMWSEIKKPSRSIGGPAPADEA